MEIEELKRCPFCGDDNAAAVASTGKYGIFVYIECGLCGARSRTFKYQGVSPASIDDVDWLNGGVLLAREAWNRRERRKTGKKE